jgi:bifunctional non-homologous end joining protein LigD
MGGGQFVAQRPEDFAVNMAKTARGAVFISIICATAEAQQQSAPIPPRPRRRPSLDPLLWDEVKNSIGPEGFTVDAVPERLAKLVSDPWADIGKLRQSLSTTVRRRVGI